MKFNEPPYLFLTNQGDSGVPNYNGSLPNGDGETVQWSQDGNHVILRGNSTAYFRAYNVFDQSEPVTNLDTEYFSFKGVNSLVQFGQCYINKGFKAIWSVYQTPPNLQYLWTNTAGYQAMPSDSNNNSSFNVTGFSIEGNFLCGAETNYSTGVASYYGVDGTGSYIIGTGKGNLANGSLSPFYNHVDPVNCGGYGIIESIASGSELVIGISDSINGIDLGVIQASATPASKFLLEPASKICLKRPYSGFYTLSIAPQTGNYYFINDTNGNPYTSWIWLGKIGAWVSAGFIADSTLALGCTAILWGVKNNQLQCMVSVPGQANYFLYSTTLDNFGYYNTIRGRMARSVSNYHLSLQGAPSK